MAEKSAQPAILFDLDGTLLNSLEDIAAAMNRILGEDGLPKHSLSAYKLFIGGGARVLVESSLPETSRANTDAYLARFRALYRDNLIVRTVPYPGILALLDVLLARKVRMSILSNKPDDMTRLLVEHFFGDIPWRGVAGARAGEPKKPDPKAAQPLIESLGVDPSRVLMVGDTKTDMQTATNTGMRGIGVTWGFRDRAELIAHGAHTVIDAPEDLLALL